MNNFLKSWLDKWNRIVVFAGVFDPVHKAHISAAETALTLGKKVVFLPERVPQHKHSTTDYTHRLNMLKIATKSNPRFEVLDYPEDHQYIEPVFKWLKAKYPASSFVWIVGSDVAPLMAKWPGVENLESLGVKGVYYLNRHGSEIGNSYELDNGVVLYQLKRRRNWKKHITHSRINSASIRENTKQNRDQLPGGVFEYLVANGLYNN
ncbi:nicotinate-nicotinamide nucleotide adenylyltransferase [Candidatus Saccharibacteria bacterium]|nr:nicotinate-nicotinamide nucleotide adenylyltransferase [Candidatus Saccharibacteria bacterium]MCA9346771.1 nicotinate-nicotinamide nucleotide adenylyltransferase [Candidatus Saccharibacteria bacterium]